MDPTNSRVATLVRSFETETEAEIAALQTRVTFVEEPAHLVAGALQLIAFFLDVPYASAVDAQLAVKTNKVRRVPVKLDARIQKKHAVEHQSVEAEHDLAPYSLNLDPIRVGVASPTANEQLEVWDRLQQAFLGRILRVKNLFIANADAELGVSKLRWVGAPTCVPPIACCCPPSILSSLS